MSAPTLLFVTQTAHTLGGVEVWLERLVARLRGEGARAVVGLVAGRKHHRPDAYLAVHPYEDVAVVPCMTGTSEGRARALVKVIEQVRPNVVVPVNVADTLEAVRRVKHSGGSVRLMAAIHGLGLSYFHDLAMYRGIVDRAVASNRLAEKALVSLGGLPEARVGYAGYGADAEREAGKGPERCDVLRIGYAGRIAQSQKRCGDLVGVAIELRRREVPFRMEIAGAGPDGERLREEFRRAGLESVVRFRGVLPHSDLLGEFYPNLDALLITSAWETGPIVAWEAMARGVVVVSSAYVGSIAEGALLHGRNALVSAVGDVAGLACQLEVLYREPERRKTLADAGREMVAVRYSWARALDGWCSEIERCLDSEPATDSRGVGLRVIAGRLDGWLGRRMGESIRDRFGLGMVHNDSGAEWPHAFTREFGEEEDVSVLSGIEGVSE